MFQNLALGDTGVCCDEVAELCQKVRSDLSWVENEEVDMRVPQA